MKGRDIGTPRAFHIADYGTADAGTSLGLLTSMIEEVRNQLGPEKEVVLHYEDQLTNEWRRLVKIVKFICNDYPFLIFWTFNPHALSLFLDDISLDKIVSLTMFWD